MINIKKFGSYKFQDLNSNNFRPCMTLNHKNEIIDNVDGICDIILSNKKLTDMRRSAECHKLVRRDLHSILRPGVKIIDVCEFIEKKIEEHFGKNDLTRGIGFPVGLSINDCAAHDTAKPNDQRIIGQNDIVKIDYGTHSNGYITDSAFTVCFNPEYTNLLKATEEATWTGIRNAGIDVYVNDLSKLIKEVIESYEVEIKGKTYGIKSICNLGGHNILPYVIHGGELILCGPSDNEIIKNMRMKSGCYAIETFASTMSNEVIGIDNVNESDLYTLKEKALGALKFDISKKILFDVRKSRKTLPFCSRWLNKEYGPRYKVGMKELYENGFINIYPPLMDKNKGMTSQLEHTIFVHDYGKEVLSYSNDY
jgi:methionyl aminopeptidase